MEKPFAAYKGDEPYVFVCYAHEDADIIYPEIKALHDKGVNIWYDEGISAGRVWREEIARAIRGSVQFIFYISRTSLTSEHCNREIHFALDKGAEILPIYLEDVELTDELDLTLSRVQALNRYADANYQLHLHESLARPIDNTLQAVREPVASSLIRRRYLLAAISVALLIGLGSWLWQKSVEPEPAVVVAEQQIPSLAVLPFVNMSDDPGQEFFSDGIAEEILSLVARNPALKVISRYSAFSFKGKDLGIPAIASQLGVKHVLEGSVRKSGNQVRITTQLIDAEADRYLWSATFDRNLDDVFAVQTEIATKVAEQLNVALLDLKPPKYSTNSEAYPIYSQARQILSLDGTLEDTLRAKSLLDRAIEVDPSYAPAWGEMSRAYGHLTGHGVYTAEEGNDLSDAARAKALRLDPDDAVANAFTGWILVLRDNELEKGIQYFEKGLSLDPTNLDILRPAVPLMHWLRKYQESLRLAEYVVERDPLCVICIGNLARTYMLLDRLTDAERLLQRGLTLSPDNIDMTRMLGENQLLLGDNQAALAWFEELPTESPRRLAGRAMALYELERQKEVNEALAKLEEQSAYTALAQYYAYTNDADNALNALKLGMAAKQAWISFFAAEHLWATDLTLDPKWQEFLEAVGLSAEQIGKLDLSVSVPS